LKRVVASFRHRNILIEITLSIYIEKPDADPQYEQDGIELARSVASSLAVKAK